MSIVIKVRDCVSGKTIEMSLVADTTVEDILIGSADFLNKEPGIYFIKFGRKILPGDITISEAGIKSGSLVELLPGPKAGL